LSPEPDPGQATGRQVEPIRQVVTVRCSPERAFTVFTERMGTWWPVESYSRAVSEFAAEGVAVTELEFQARLGGSILEHLSDGRVLPWAEIIAWHPPRNVRMRWRPHSLPEPPTEVGVTFTARGEGATMVELEQGGWERLSEDFREELHDVYARGWVTTIARFAAAAEDGTA
jgi:Activator of Hsp90 ATPase homolog 1-like protein